MGSGAVNVFLEIDTGVDIWYFLFASARVWISRVCLGEGSGGRRDR